MRRFVIYGVAAGLLGLAVYSQQQHPQNVGQLKDGSFLLNTGWPIRPAGQEIPLSTWPVSADAPDGRMLAALNGGYLPSSVDLLDMETVKKVSGAEWESGMAGAVFSPDGAKLYAGGGARGSIVEVTTAGNISRSHAVLSFSLARSPVPRALMPTPSTRMIDYSSRIPRLTKWLSWIPQPAQRCGLSPL